MVRIIDASVAIKWFVEEEGREKALEILGEVLDSPGRFAVPELFYFELAHIFNRLIETPTPEQTRLLDQVTLLAVQRFSMTSELLEQIRRFQKIGLSGYDAAYVGLAKLLRGTWITFDHTAHKRIAHLRLSEAL